MKKVILVLLILGIIGYSAYLVAIPHYNYLAFKSDALEFLRISIRNYPEKTKKEIMKIAEEYDIPIEKGDIYLQWNPKKGFLMRVAWVETVDFFGIYQKSFKFQIDTIK